MESILNVYSIHPLIGISTTPFIQDKGINQDFDVFDSSDECMPVINKS